MLCARSYQSRSFDLTLLHRCVSAHWPNVRAACETHGRPLPAFVKREFDAYLRCGDLSAHDRFHRERLCRYLLRPPLAKLP